MPARCTVTIDGTKIDAVSASVKFSTLKDRAGRPELGSLASSIVVAIDFHDEEACPHSTLKKLFNMSKEPTKENINKDMKIEFWKDDGVGLPMNSDRIPIML